MSGKSSSILKTESSTDYATTMAIRICWLPGQKRTNGDSIGEQCTLVNKHTRDQTTIVDTQLQNFTTMQQANHHIAT